MTTYGRIISWSSCSRMWPPRAVVQVERAVEQAAVAADQLEPHGDRCAVAVGEAQAEGARVGAVQDPQAIHAGMHGCPRPDAPVDQRERPEELHRRLIDAFCAASDRNGLTASCAGLVEQLVSRNAGLVAFTGERRSWISSSNS